MPTPNLSPVGVWSPFSQSGAPVAVKVLIPWGTGYVGAMDAVRAQGVAWVLGGQQTGSADSEFAPLPLMLASTPLATSRRLFQTRWWFRPHPFPLKFVSTPLYCRN